MCKNTWPEGGAEYFEVLTVREGESDESAIERARPHYGPDAEYIVMEKA